MIAEKLDSKLAVWSPDTVSQVERLVEEIIEMVHTEIISSGYQQDLDFSALLAQH